ncbi:MAG: zf-HC2 domain-containing protein [Ardenticatenaceae bacterium]|nr:zf-HC2 domain-containing protein [Ardenticatenaceae bacterium]MCB9443414.1 zf-HC2 domain-containing protein [Ardenticatenaceae bacterium]
MKCEELVQYLSDYIDQDLDEELVAEAQEHLATCHNCRVVLDTTQQTIFLFREQGKRTIPAQRRQHLFDQLQDTFLKE